MALLEVTNLVARYGRITALSDVSLTVDEGEVVTLIGANGAGKTTTLRTISGLMRPASGTIRFDGRDITRVAPNEIVRAGIGHSPEGRRVFPRMTVRENLELGAYTRRAKDEIAADIDTVMELLRNLGAGPLTLWRPPYGRCLARATAEIAAERGLQLSGWTIDPRDYDGRDPVAMHDEVNKSLDPSRETVVLLHDGHREHGAQSRRPDAGNTVALTGLLLAEDENAFTVLDGGLVDGLGLGPPDGS